MSVIVLGSINTDLVIRTDQLPQPGETRLGGEFYQAGGGKGANQAVAAARAALSPVTFVAAVGADAFGRETLARLRTENLQCEYIREVRETATGVALILVDKSGQNLISVASGANMALSRADISAIPDAVFQTARVFVTGLELPIETVRAGLTRARAHGLITVLNPAPAMPEIVTSGLLALVDVLTPNEIEAAQLADAVRPDLEAAVADAPRSPLASARLLNAAGCRQVIVTLGRAGCLICSAEGSLQVPGRAVHAVDATAAGDAFTGVLAVALSEGRAIREAALWANTAASISVTRRGAQPSLPKRSEIQAALQAAGPHATSS